jgi:hypothetical protein
MADPISGPQFCGGYDTPAGLPPISSVHDVTKGITSFGKIIS